MRERERERELTFANEIRRHILRIESSHEREESHRASTIHKSKSEGSSKQWNRMFMSPQSDSVVPEQYQNYAGNDPTEHLEVDCCDFIDESFAVGDPVEYWTDVGTLYEDVHV